MRNLALHIFTLIFVSTAWAQLGPVKGKGQKQTTDTTIERLRVPLNQMSITNDKAVLIETGNTNILVNPGFETKIASGGWTASGGTAALATGEAIGFGDKSITWTPAASGNTFGPAIVSVPNALKSGNAEASVYYQSAAANHSFLVLDQNSNIIAGVSLPASVSYTKYSLNFVAPGDLAASIKPEVRAGSTTPISVDEFRIGAPTNTATGHPVVSGNYVATTANFGTITLSNFQFSQNGDRLTIRGNFTAGTVGASPAAVSLPPIYTINTSRYSTASGNVVGSYGTVKTSGTGAALVDASNNSAIFFSPNQGSTNNTTPNSGSNVSANNAIFSFEATVFVNQGAGQQTLTPNTTPAYYQGAHDATCTWSLTNTAFANYTADASCALVDGPKANISATTVGSVRPALALTLPKFGAYSICAKGSFFGSVATGHAHRLWDGTTVIATGSETSSAEADTIPLCGLYFNTSLTPTIEIQSNAGSGTNNLQPQRAGVNAVEWSIIDVSQSFPSPVFVGSVTSSSPGPDKIERARVAIGALCSSTPCSISTNPGNWISSVSRASTGVYTLNINSGVFSEVPSCHLQHSNTETSWDSGATATALGFRTWTSAGAAADVQNMNFICMGPK